MRSERRATPNGPPKSASTLHGSKCRLATPMCYCCSRGRRRTCKRSPSGHLPEKVRLILLVPDQQPSVPSPADLPAPIADLYHALFVAVPMPPKFGVGPNFNCVHAFRDCERPYLAHVLLHAPAPLV